MEKIDSSTVLVPAWIIDLYSYSLIAHFLKVISHLKKVFDSLDNSKDETLTCQYILSTHQKKTGTGNKKKEIKY